MHSEIEIQLLPWSAFPHLWHFTIPMAPNHFLHHLRQTITGSSLLTQHSPACGQQFQRRGGLTKHLNAAHPNYTECDNISSLDKASIQFGFTHHAPESSLQSQVACASSSSPDTLNGTKPPKRHHKFRFTFHGGFLMRFESVDLANATDNEHCCVHSDSEASLPSSPSPLVFPHSDASLTHYSMNMDVDENRISNGYLAKHGGPIPPSPISSSHATIPSSPVPSHWDNPQTDGQKHPTPKYLRTYHPKLNSWSCYLPLSTFLKAM